MQGIQSADCKQTRTESGCLLAVCALDPFSAQPGLADCDLIGMRLLCEAPFFARETATAQRQRRSSTPSEARALSPMAARRRCRRRLSTANGSAGLATRHVSSRNTRAPPSGIAYRNDGTSRCVPHRPAPAAGCSPRRSLPRTLYVCKPSRQLMAQALQALAQRRVLPAPRPAMHTQKISRSQYKWWTASSELADECEFVRTSHLCCVDTNWTCYFCRRLGKATC